MEKKNTVNVQTDHTLCRLGKWLLSDEVRELRNGYPELCILLKQIEEPHKQLHQSAIGINKLLQEGSFAEAYSNYNNFSRNYALQTLDVIDKIQQGDKFSVEIED